MEIKNEYFGPLLSMVADDCITDIDYNGTDLWITDLESGRRCISGEELREMGMTPSFVEQFSQRIANLVSRQFNKRSPVLEAETDCLRVTILHESVSRTGRCISIRKTPPVLRLTPQKAISENYCSAMILKFLANCVEAHMNLVFCGLPGAGKTESLKFFSSLIPLEERVITIEDTLEIHYSKIHICGDCVEMKVDGELFTYTDAIKASLRLNPRWLMLSEARSAEVRYLLESWSTGVHGMTTIHTSDVRNLPDRILNMLGSRLDADRLENAIYQTVDAAVLLRSEEGHRFIDQIGLFGRENGTNVLHMAVFDRKWILNNLPEDLLTRFRQEGIGDPFSNEKISSLLGEGEIPFENMDNAEIKDS